MTITRAITHSGAFHADDLFAYAVLWQLFRDIQLLRTRDAETISSAGEDTIVFDVGNEYDPERLRFDHHQIDKPLRDEGLAYSSFGLIWKHYGLDYVTKTTGLTGKDAERVQARVDARLVRDIDAVDNGTLMPDQAGATHPLTIASMLADFRPDFDDDDADAMDAAFQRASFMARKFLEAKVRKVTASLRSDAIVKDAIANRTDPRWIELPRGMNYQGVIQNSHEDEILFVVNPTTADEWQLNVVTVARGSYEARQDLPESWAGLRDSDLAAVTGVEDAVFCHTGRFIAIARTREGIMQMLNQALAEAKTADVATVT